ncbi:MAG: hypothetical protein WD648_05960 [Planctomycetaceae bacterium]
MTEPDVALTDFAIALECVVFAVLLWRNRVRATGLRFWFALFFASVSVASLCGGLVHGFFLDEQSRGQAILWPATLLAIGVAAFSAWAIGATLVFPPRVSRSVKVAAVGQLAIYSPVVLFHNQEFAVALVNNLPAIVFLLIVLVLAYRREKHQGLLLAAGGLALTLIGGLGQQLGIGIHPKYFNHNALYHVIQAVALFLFFLGGRGLLVEPDESAIL